MKMYKNISTWLLKISSTWLMIASLLLMAGFLILVLPAQAAVSFPESGSERSPDTTFYYTPEALYQMAEEYGAKGRQAYIQTRWTFDLVFPLVYTCFLAVGISWFVQRLNGWADAWKLTNLIPVLGGSFDLLENSAATLAMSSFPAKPQILLSAASLFTPIKWVLVGASFIPYFVFVLAWLIRQIQSRNN